METKHEYDSASPLWWGINPDGRPDMKKLASVVEAAVRVAQPERIILFGSGARGTMTADSDIDILVIAETRDRRATARPIRAARPRRCAPLDITVITAAEVELNQDDRCCFIHEALKEGRVLYERNKRRSQDQADQRIDERLSRIETSIERPLGLHIAAATPQPATPAGE